ncbi:MAG: Uma2 family endonuclease [Lachnospiraceae bacterium]|nr:Uma2 family endonuclease [Lachnospiraceae bacterium]
MFNHINAKKGNCRVYPAPFGVRLSETTVVEPDITVVCDKDKLTDKAVCATLKALGYDALWKYEYSIAVK